MTMIENNANKLCQEPGCIRFGTPCQPIFVDVFQNAYPFLADMQFPVFFSSQMCCKIKAKATSFGFTKSTKMWPPWISTRHRPTTRDGPISRRVEEPLAVSATRRTESLSAARLPRDANTHRMKSTQEKERDRFRVSNEILRNSKTIQLGSLGCNRLLSKAQENSS